MAKLLGYPSACRGSVGVRLYAEVAYEVVHIHCPVHGKAVLAGLLDCLCDLVMLVPDLAYQLLQYILHSYHSAGAAVFVQHHRHVGLLSLQELEYAAYLLVFQHIHRRGDYMAYIPVNYAVARIKVLLVYHAYYVVNIPIIHRQAGILCLGKHFGDILLACVLGHRLHIHPVGEYVLRLPLGELYCVLQKLALAAVYAALLLDLVNEHQKLLLRHLIVAFQPEYSVEQLFPQGKQPIQRAEYHREQPKKGG